MKVKKYTRVLCALALIVVFVTGCQSAQRPTPQNNTGRNTQQNTQQNMTEGQNGVENDRVLEKRTTPMVPKDAMDQDQDLSLRAEKIVNEVVRLKEVEGCTVVISDNTALVGIDLPGDVEGKLTTDVKKKVEDVVKRTDSEIDRVAISADPDIFDKIEGIAKEAGRGRPLSGFAEEIEDLIRRIIPNA